MEPADAMAIALREAARGRGRTFPNPCVGAVVALGDRVLGRGHSRPAGGAHAEVVAIEQARRRAGEAALRRATLFVTLEPCCHFGRTPPCTDAILSAGIRRVVVGVRDPHPFVAGGGLRRLRRAGVRVDVGALGEECRAHHRGFLSVCERGRPWLSLKLASTLDGRIATSTGDSRWITSPRARAFVHELRAQADALLVGAGTALADDPELTARRGARVVRAPVRVLFDRRLRVPLSARLYAREPGSAWVVCAAGARGRASRERAGARVIEVRGGRTGLDLGEALARLGREGLTEVLCEGGGTLAASLLREGLVDEIHWFAAPKLVGGDGLPALGALGVERVGDAHELEIIDLRRLGPDIYLRARPRAHTQRSR